MSKSLAELAKITGATLQGDPDHIITGVENLELATSEHAAFVENKRYARKSASSKAGVIFIHPDLAQNLDRNLLLHPHPSLAFQKTIELFLKPAKSGFESIHPTAVIHESVKLGKGVCIGPYTTIDQGCLIEDHVTIEPHVTIGPEVTIGAHSHIHAKVVVRERCSLGKRVILQPGAVIGSCGFGYFTSPMGKHEKLAHLGNVIIEDDVEVGANTTIDRARFKSTIVRKGTKIDNLVQIAHQVELGEDNIIVSQVGIAGSTKTGKLVVLGGQTGVAGHIELTDQVTVAACSAVSKSLTEKGNYYGTPAMIDHEFKEHFMALRGLKRLTKRVKTLEESQSK